MRTGEIQVFTGEEFSVRTTTDAAGTVWFVARDIAEGLGYTDESIRSINKLMANVPEIWKGRKPFPTPGGEQDMLCLTEQGVYFFLGRSDKPKALPYQMWIAGEVVPQIRSTGRYTPDFNNEFTPVIPPFEEEEKKAVMPTKLPATSAAVKAAERIISKAFKCKKANDFKTVLALDEVFILSFGCSALDIAGLHYSVEPWGNEFYSGYNDFMPVNRYTWKDNDGNIVVEATDWDDPHCRK